jgi:tubulin alpha
MPTYLITGTSSGIGLELVRQLALRGEKIYATCRARASKATGEDLLSSVASSGDVTVVEGIDTMDDGVGAALKAALAGVTLDVIIHNAGTCPNLFPSTVCDLAGRRGGSGGLTTTTENLPASATGDLPRALVLTPSSRLQVVSTPPVI